MKRRDVIKLGFLGVTGFYINPVFAKLNYLTKTERPILFKPNWESLSRYKVPDWFRDAKFGIWAHWGPQCVPEAGDWYARGMYQEHSSQKPDK